MLNYIGKDSPMRERKTGEGNVPGKDNVVTLKNMV